MQKSFFTVFTKEYETLRDFTTGKRIRLYGLASGSVPQKPHPFFTFFKEAEGLRPSLSPNLIIPVLEIHGEEIIQNLCVT